MEDDVINDLKKMKLTNFKVAEQRTWRLIIEKAKTFKFEVLVP